jgi:hypothetical protein
MLGMVVHTCNPSYLRGRRLMFQGNQGKRGSKILSQKQNENQRDMSQVVECLPSMHKTLGSIPVPQNKPCSERY